MSAPSIDAPRRIAVLRALQLGDLLVATPALRAIRAAFPHATITLIGLPWTGALVSRLRCVDDWLELPGYPGLPEHPPDVDALPAFFARARDRSFDLALQMHGSGPIVNDLVARLGATRCAGFHPRGTPCPDATSFTPWPEQGREIDRLLALTTFLGMPARGRRLELEVDDSDRQRLRRTLPAAFEARPIVVHPGARLPSRRWPVERFAEVADALADAGHPVVITGSAQERGLVSSIRERMSGSAIDMAGRTDLGTLAALIDRAAMIVANDTGVSHVAAARGTPSVIVSSGGDAARWAPLDTTRHRVLHRDVACRPCGHVVCPTGHECALGVPVTEVLDTAFDLLRKRHEWPDAA